MVKKYSLPELDHILVTKEDIDLARSQDRWNCAIVRAIQRQVPDALFVRVDKEKISYSVGSHRFTHDTPQVAIDKVIKPLDEHRQVRPVSFDLPPATMKQTQKITPEKKRQLRNIERIRSDKEKRGDLPNRTSKDHGHNRFRCVEGSL